MNYEPGERADCKICGYEILWNSTRWQHVFADFNHDAIPEEKPKTVKVKIAVAIDSNGNWNAAGWGNGPGQTLYNESDQSMMEIATEEENGGFTYWLTAKLELPEVKEIEVSEIERVTE